MAIFMAEIMGWRITTSRMIYLLFTKIKRKWNSYFPKDLNPSLPNS
jgi:hypothetical protein